MFHIMFTLALFFQSGTTKVIYAYHPEDPSSENTILGHNTINRGSRSLLLLNMLEKIPSLPSDTQTFDILHDKVRTVKHFVLSYIPFAFCLVSPEGEVV